MVKKKVDARIRTLLENGVKTKHRTLILIVGQWKDQRAHTLTERSDAARGRRALAAAAVGPGGCCCGHAGWRDSCMDWHSSAIARIAPSFAAHLLNRTPLALSAPLLRPPPFAAAAGDHGRDHKDVAEPGR